MLLDLSNSEVSKYMAPSANGNWRCIKNGCIITGGILSYYKRVGNMDLCGLTILGLPLSNELVPKPGTAYQVFERGIVCYDPAHKIDSAVGNSYDCYLMHIDGGLGNATLLKTGLATLNKEIIGLNAQITELDEQVKTLTSTNASQKAQIAQLELSTINTTAAQIASYKQAIAQIETLLQSVSQ
jgi:hypothetical protein